MKRPCRHLTEPSATHNVTRNSKRSCYVQQKSTSRQTSTSSQAKQMCFIGIVQWALEFYKTPVAKITNLGKFIYGHCGLQWAATSIYLGTFKQTGSHAQASSNHSTVQHPT